MEDRKDHAISTSFDWNITPPNCHYENAADSVVMAAEHFEFDILKSRNGLRTDREREQFIAIISAYICNALPEESSKRRPGFEIDFDTNPCPFNSETPANEAARDTLNLLCQPGLEFFRIIGETSGVEGEPYAFTVIVADHLLELFGRVAGSTVYASASPTMMPVAPHPEETSPIVVPPERRSHQGVAYAKASTSSGDLSETVAGRAPNPLDHSRPLDVHVSSEHPEVKVFVNETYDRYFDDGGNPDIRKKHVKVILLDLYVAWSIDPDLKIAIHRNVDAYKGKSRYNELHISKLTIPVVDRLVEVGLIEQAIGFNDRVSGIGRMSRIWPTPKLVQMFEEARFGPDDIEASWEQETIVLRDNNKKDIDYPETDETRRMRKVVNGYNALMRRTFIDIPVLEKRYIETEKTSGGKPHRLEISQRNKVTRRIFNRGSFDKGGRFFGGWWQQCPKEWRGKIFINDEPTSELDYSGLHAVMLYAQEGIDYWADIGTDPYTIDCPEFDGSKEELRDTCKQLLLISLNAASNKATIQAFRNEAPDGSPQKGMGNGILSSLLDSLRKKHEPISHMIANDAGIDLMNQDSRIAEHVIAHFTFKDIPVLTIHDSFIMPMGLEMEMDQEMQRAYAAVMKEATVKIKEETERPMKAFQRKIPQLRAALELSGLKLLRTRPEHPDFVERFNVPYEARTNPKRSPRYQQQLRLFRERQREQANPAEHSASREVN